MFRSFASTLLLGVLLPLLAFGYSDPKKRYTRAEYIAMWKDEAIKQMKEHGIPASITLAQAILESGDGNSELARDANNHFGIKCHDWQGKKVYHDDDKRGECFRKYGSASESFEDHSLFLKRSRYLFLYEYKPTDYEAWAKGLKKAGYATNPKYPELLIKLIEENNLHQYDSGVYSKREIASAKKKSTRAKSGDEIVINIEKGFEVSESPNRIKYIITDAPYSIDDLAQKMEMGPWQIRKYNDLKKDERIAEGERIYLQPKRNKSRNHEYHVVKEGESLRDISQEYGVKIKKILKWSGLEDNYRAKAGDKLKLRR